MTTTPISIPGTPFNLVGRYALSHDDYDMRRRTDYIVVHCADTRPSMNTTAADIRGWHVKERGWEDIGYHFVIRRDGTIELGRPVWAVGAGVFGYNACSIHICLVGGRAEHSKAAEDNFTPVQKDALLFLINTIQDEREDYSDAEVIGHRDLDKGKECPSFPAREWFKAEQEKMKKALVG